MHPHMFAAGLRIESSQHVSNPSPARLHTRAPTLEEIDLVEFSDPGGLTKQPRHDVVSINEPQTPRNVHQADYFSHAYDVTTPNELEASQPPTPTQHEVSSIVPSFFFPAMNKWRVLAACLIYFSNGMNDSAPGALIPYIEKWYDIGYAVVSLIWITNALGFIVAAFFTESILARLGRARGLMLSETIMMIGYIAIACAAPFPVVTIAYFVLGFGYALNLAYNNVFCANLAHSTVILGLAHGSYGIGGTVAPIIATLLVSHGIEWSRFYLITIGLRICCFFFAGWAFWNYEKEGTTQFANSLRTIASNQAAARGDNRRRLLGRALRNKVTILASLLIFSYQGSEVSISGWFLSYLINVRGGDPEKVGYVTSGFWAGITLGRFTLTHAAHRIGEKKFVFAMGIGVIILQLLAWFVPSVIGDAVSVALLGLLLGPVYPCAQTVFARLLPGNIQMIAISFISSAGSSGGAVVPFLTGLLAQSVGTKVLNPVCIAFYVVMLLCWMSLPKISKRRE